MFGHTHTMKRMAAAMGIVASLAAWAAQPALPFDGRSPDTRDAAAHAKLGALVDARSPDTRDAAAEAKENPLIPVVVDARSPDTRDAATRTEPSLLVDLRSPDARDAATRTEPSLLVDLRSPDARDAAERPRPSLPVDLRSPDARDASFRALPETRIVPIDRVSPEGFDWGDFGIGFGVALASMLVLAGLAAGGLMARQKRGRKTSPAAA